MKNLYLTIALILLSTFGFAQYGPVPYRSVEQTIGEEYVILPGERAKITGYFINKGEDPSKEKSISYKQGAGKTLKLVSVFNYTNLFRQIEKHGKFVDSVGNYYTSHLIKDKSFLYLVPKSELQMARKALLNTTLWLKNGEVQSQDDVPIQGLRSKPLTVVDVQLGDNGNFPQLLTVKTETGLMGFIRVNVSGINLESNSPSHFFNLFFEESPQVTAAKSLAAEEAKKAQEKLDIQRAVQATMDKYAAEDKLDPCLRIEYTYDKFKQEKTFSTAITDDASSFNCSFQKFISKGGVATYYLALRTIGETALATKKGVIVLLKNGKRISKPNAEVETDVNASAQFVRSAFITLNAADIALLKTSPIEGYKLYIDEDSPNDPDRLYKVFQCLLTKK